jgi:hypothetical protein
MKTRTVVVIFVMMVVVFSSGFILGSNYFELNILPRSEAEIQSDLNFIDVLPLTLQGASQDEQRSLLEKEPDLTSLASSGKYWTVGRFYELKKGQVHFLSGKIHGYYIYSEKGEISVTFGGNSFSIQFNVGEVITLENCLKFKILFFDETKVIMELIEYWW